MSKDVSKRGLARGAAVLALGAALAGAAPAARAWAQGLSARPVAVIVPYSPGTPPDIVARIMTEALQRRWSQPFVVDNRPGASGNIGTEAATRTAPDGHALLVTACTIATNASLFRKLPYDPVASLAQIALLASIDFALVAHPSAGATVAEFLDRARRSPGRLNSACPGVGTPHHLAMELFKQRSGIDVAHVPYRGAAGAVSDILAGNVAAMFIPANSAVELAKDGRARILAVAAESRPPHAPDAPTMAEAGVAGVVVRDWYALFAPAGTGTPAEVVRRYNEAVNAALAAPEVAGALAGQGMTVIGGPPERLRDRLAANLGAWAKVIREAGITAD